MVKPVCCMIDNSGGMSRLISTASCKFKTVDFQWEIILGGIVPGIHRLGYIQSEDEHIWIADFSASKSLSQIDTGNQSPDLGIFRIQQIVGVLLKAEDYLFKNYQAYLNPEAIRFSGGNSNFEAAASIVFLPLDLDIGHDQYKLRDLLRQIALAYQIPEKQANMIIETYETHGLIRLDSMLAAECMKNSDESEQPTADRIVISPAAKNSEKRIAKNIWLLSHIFWLTAAGFNLVAGPELISASISRVPFIIGMLIFGIILAAHDIRSLRHAPDTRQINSRETQAESGNKKIIARKTRTKKSIVGSRKNQLDYDIENQTEIVKNQDSDFRMAMLSQGLPGTPEELEGIRAFILLDEFIIGREESEADLWLASSTVGRRHARICRREGSFFITDLGSRNGTLMDGRKLNKNEDYLLPDRCRLTFADQSYYFQTD